MESILESIYSAVIDGEMDIVRQNTKIALDLGIDPAEILDSCLIKAMSEVGHRFECGEFYVPEMLIAARAMQAGMAILKPHLAVGNIKSKGKVLIGTVKGDLHDIGKNLVSMMLEGAGFEIKDLGTDVSADKFLMSIREYQPDILALSALLTTTMPYMKTTIDALEADGLREKVKILIGGAPVTEAYAKQIGADGYSSDASRAASLASSLMKG
jgi:5-methyltetrahydrofolate--homocysteine methyltransferase